MQRATNQLPGGTTLCLFLGGVGCAPKRARIDAVWIEFEHYVIELTRVRSCFVQAVEIAKVLPRLANDTGIIVVFRHLMPGNHGFRFQGLELVERGDPLKPALCVGLAEVGMNSVVDGVPANDQSNRRDVQAGGGSRIGPPAFTATSLCPSSSSSSSSSGSAINKRSGIWPGKSRRQKFSILSGDRCSCMALTTSGVATALARGKRSRSDARPKK